MEKEIQIFSNEEFGQVRTMQDQRGRVFFCAKDVCKALGYVRTDNAVRQHVEKADALKQCIRSGGQHRTLLFVNESGLYSLILGAKLESARRFKSWVTGEVLPMIRKDGGYMVGCEEESDEEIMARALQIMQRTIDRRNAQIALQQEKIDELTPPAEFAREVLESVNCLTTTQIAKELNMTGIELNLLLCARKIQYKQSGQYLLYAQYARQGLAKNRTHGCRDSRGVVHTNSYLVWTERGRAFVHEVVKGKL